VFDSQGISGKYSIAIGTIEDFSLVDFFTILPTAWVDTKLFFEDYASLAIFFTVLIGFPSMIFFLIRNKRRIAASAKP